MKTNVVGAVVVIAVLLTTGCSKRLTEERARELIEATPVVCTFKIWTPDQPGPIRRVEQTGAYEVRYENCAQALKAAGMGNVGAFNYVGPNGAGAPFTLPPSAQEEGDKVLVPCGSIHVLSVSGITTTENTAVFTYERDLVLAPRADEVIDRCILEAPAAAHATRERSARRDDEGTWSLLPATR